MFEQTEQLVELPSDTATAQGQYLRYRQINDSTYTLFWGSRLVESQLQDPLQIGMSNHYPQLEYLTEDYIVLNRTCGSPCWFGMVLPIKNNAKESFYFAPLAYDIERNLVIHVGNADSLWVENYSTGEKQSIVLTECEAAFLGFCVEDIKFERAEVVLQLFPDSDNNEHISRRFTLMPKVIKYN